MQKLKKVFSPGNDKDDETMYGSPSARKAHAESSPVDQATTSPTTTGTSSGRDHGISRQILNPGGDKYDEQRFGTSTSGQPQTAHLPEERESALEDRMGEPKEDPGVKRQVLNPSRSTHDEAGYGATGFNPASASHGSSVRPDHTTAGSALSMKSGVLGSPDQSTEERALHSDGITSQGRSDEPTNFSRNAALTGAAAGAEAGGAYAATRSGDDPLHTDRSFPLSGGAIAPHNDNRPTSSVYSAERPEPATTSSGIGYVPGLNTGTAGGTGESSGEAALESLGLGRHNIIDHNGHSHEFNGDPCEVEPAEKTLAHIPGPHATVAANMLDPHVPGEFPADDGFDPHGSHNLAAQTGEPSDDHHYGRDAALAGGAGAVGVGAYEALKDRSSPAQQSSSSPSPSSGIGYPAQLGSHEALVDRTVPTQQPAYPQEQPSEKHHYGRDAALAGGAGAAGLGAYEATRDSEPTAPQQPHDASALDPSTSQSRVSQPIARNQSPQHVAGNPLTGAREPQQEHHYGRDAALAGGAGAAGLGAGRYLNDRNTSDPVSAGVSPQTTRDGIVTEPTTGLPMNVGKYGAGTGGTDASRPIAGHYNDPPVGSSQEPLGQDKEHHYGRDAALAGGAGAAGSGAYEYAKDRSEIDPASTRTLEPYSSTADPRAQPSTTGYAPAKASTPHQSETSNKADPRVPTHAQHAQQVQEPPPAQNEHHYGHDAALAGGAGAAGAAGYAALQDDRNDTGPASKTIGPHKSNIANIVDPRVRPEPEKMKDHTTSGPWQSDTLNKMDPKVESDPSKADVEAHGYASGGPTTLPVQQQQEQQYRQAPVDQDKDHHYGRDAAVVGGAGAAAYGADQAYDKHEQEKLAKEQEKQAQHEAKERVREQEKQVKHDAKEQEKQAKHDQKEADKQAKHDAHEAEKARKKEEEKHAKEQENLEKHHAKEQEKAEEKRLKEQEKTEEKRQKELEKLQHEKEKEDAKLNSARYDEAEAKHNQHNKLHKPAPEERDEKGGILHRIFHHKHYERDGAEGSSREGGSFEHERPTGLNDGNVGGEAFGREGVPSSTGRTAGEQSALGESSLKQPGLGGEGDGMVTEPTTGLPMNVGKYGHTGGTDANEAITGHYAK